MFSGIPYNRFLDTPLGRWSIDSLRVKFTYPYKTYNFESHEAEETINKLLSLIDSVYFFSHSGLDVQLLRKSYFSIGSYAYTVKVSGQSSDGSFYSFAVLLGRYCFDNSVKNVAPDVILDVNPNKVPYDVLSMFVRLLRASSRSVSLLRFDLALDLPLPRDCVFLHRDARRGYRLFDEGGARTEYQGKRDSHGAMKLYDKTKEADLPSAVTRCELTISTDKSTSIADVFPSLYSLSPTQLDFSFSSLPFQVQSCILHPDLLPVLKSCCTLNTWKKYQAIIDSVSSNVLFPDDWSLIDSFVGSTLLYYLSGVSS